MNLKMHPIDLQDFFIMCGLERKFQRNIYRFDIYGQKAYGGGE